MSKDRLESDEEQTAAFNECKRILDESPIRDKKGFSKLLAGLNSEQITILYTIEVNRERPRADVLELVGDKDIIDFEIAALYCLENNYGCAIDFMEKMNDVNANALLFPQIRSSLINKYEIGLIKYNLKIIDNFPLKEKLWGILFKEASECSNQLIIAMLQRFKEKYLSHEVARPSSASRWQNHVDSIEDSKDSGLRR